MTQDLDRRPLASRNTRWAEAVTRVLVKWGASPNGISVFGMAAGLAAGGLFAATAVTDEAARRLCWLLGAVCVQLRLLANLFDGMVAVASGRTSKLGELFNEFPDRISDVAILVGLGYAAGGVPEWGYLAAIAALFTAYIRALGKTAGAPSIYCGPMAKQHRMAVVTVSAVACAVLPLDAVERYQIPVWAAGLCAIGALVTVVRRGMIISGHLRNARS